MHTKTRKHANKQISKQVNQQTSKQFSGTVQFKSSIKQSSIEPAKNNDT
jgi:hypothetical protein